ncbi:hypothetical protein ZHAS_00010699 [Anopheles sinensis]|uniref:Uncharacterized protein n=1 Tax=Anopheles sinensis TaxID=74873 RepID=A0A084VYI2_ANOSI|nr:hypothetical protein ZHAS_00010699 [Anopheles sinensis]
MFCPSLSDSSVLRKIVIADDKRKRAKRGGNQVTLFTPPPSTQFPSPPPIPTRTARGSHQIFLRHLPNPAEPLNPDDPYPAAVRAVLKLLLVDSCGAIERVYVCLLPVAPFPAARQAYIVASFVHLPHAPSSCCDENYPPANIPRLVFRLGWWKGERAAGEGGGLCQPVCR